MKLSIITTCLNSKDTILYTLNSIMCQTYTNIEHIIVDGGSTDGTIDIIKNYPFLNKKIFFRKNIGIYEGINYGIKKSSGEIISILNADDILQSKNIVFEMISIIKKHRNKKIFLGNVVYFNKDNFEKVSRFYPSTNFTRNQMYYGIMPPHPASFIRKEVYNKTGLYNEQFKIAGDFDMFLRAIYINKLSFKKINKTVVRMKTGGISGRDLKSYAVTTREIRTSFKINNIKNNLFRIIKRIPSKLHQYLNLDQKKLNKGFKNVLLNYGLTLTNNYFQIILNQKLIPFKKNFILSGMNLAFLGYYLKNETKSHPDQYHWPDGLFAKYLKLKIKKIPGRELLVKLKIPKSIKKINIIGNCSVRNLEYMKKKFNLPIRIIPLPYGSVESMLHKKNIILKKNHLTFITLPTPKQEMFAYKLAEKNKYFQIICIGASISLASKEEKPVPKWMSNYEFIWRLQSDTSRRVKRLLESIFHLVYGSIINKKKIHINIIDE